MKTKNPCNIGDVLSAVAGIFVYWSEITLNNHCKSNDCAYIRSVIIGKAMIMDVYALTDTKNYPRISAIILLTVHNKPGNSFFTTLNTTSASNSK